MNLHYSLAPNFKFPNYWLTKIVGIWLMGDFINELKFNRRLDISAHLFKSISICEPLSTHHSLSPPCNLIISPFNSSRKFSNYRKQEDLNSKSTLQYYLMYLLDLTKNLYWNWFVDFLSWISPLMTPTDCRGLNLWWFSLSNALAK